MDIFFTRNQQDGDIRKQELFSVIWSRDDPQKVQELLEQGIGPDGVNSICDGKSILHVCVEKNRYESAVFLSSQTDLNVNIRNQYNETPLHVTIRKELCLKMFELLLTHDGIDVNVHGRDEQTPLHLIIDHNRSDMLKKILERDDIEFNSVNIHHGLAFHASVGKCFDILLQDSRVDVNMSNIWGETKLSLVVLQDDLGLVRQLMNHPKICMNPKDDHGCTPIFWMDGASDIHDFPGAQLLLQDERTILTTRDNDGNTILDYPMVTPAAVDIIQRAERQRLRWAQKKVNIISHWSFDDKVIPDDVLNHHLLPHIADVITPVDELLTQATQ